MTVFIRTCKEPDIVKRIDNVSIINKLNEKEIELKYCAHKGIFWVTYHNVIHIEVM